MPDFRFSRLTDVPPADLLEHMRDPRLAQHMPLLSGDWTEARIAAFVAAKDACWTRDGLGHWAFWSDGVYVGWGGFQKEGAEWDFGLVLRPAYFGLGLQITKKALEFARNDARIPYVTFLLPPSRRHLGALKRMGAEQVGEMMYEGNLFLKFRLETA